MTTADSESHGRAATGVPGLDDVLAGGLPANRLHLVQGDPGTGKTTLALQFLLEGVRRGETGLYISLSETEEEIRAVAASHGWSLDAISIYDLSVIQSSLQGEDENTLFNPSEVDLRETTALLLAQIERVRPTRVVFDSLSELRLLAQSALRYRRQILAFKQFFAGKRSTVLLLDDRTSEPGDMQLQSLAHGVILVEQSLPAYGAERRRLRILKMRGVKFRGGYHDFQVQTGGVVVYPRLVSKEHAVVTRLAQISTGAPALDELIGGGLDLGASTLLVGPPGTGKSVLATQFAHSVASRGERVVMFTFEEGTATLFARAAALGMDLEPHVASGRIVLQSIDPAEVSPGEFDFAVRRQVDEGGARLVVIDSLNGYLNSMPEERFLILQMHELLTFLNRRGVATVMVMAQAGLVGTSMASPVDVSYLADSVVLLRFFEATGKVRRAISVTKRRGGAHEDTIREFSMDATGLRIGAPLSGFQGVLTGVPTYVGSLDRLDDEHGKGT